MNVFHSHTIFNEYLIPGVLVLYFLNRKKRRFDYVFSFIYSLIKWALPVFTVLYLLDLNPFTLFTYSWTTWTTPAQYIIFILALYQVIFERTDDQPYAVTLSLQMALASGYLYEIPRYLVLQGLPRIIRYDRSSLFPFQYAIISLFFIVILLIEKKAKIDRWALLGGLNYLGYCLVYYFFNDWLMMLRRNCIHFLWVDIPWINLYRLPTMFFLLSLTRGIKND